jgi:hypothetical protein
MRRIALLSFAMSALLCACEDVPTLTFPDAAPDAAQDAGEGGSDAGPESTCSQPNDAAPAPYVCCGAVACEGQCSGNCDLCTRKCTDPETFCCAKTNNVICLPLTSVCR